MPVNGSALSGNLNAARMGPSTTVLNSADLRSEYPAHVTANRSRTAPAGSLWRLSHAPSVTSTDGGDSQINPIHELEHLVIGLP